MGEMGVCLVCHVLGHGELGGELDTGRLELLQPALLRLHLRLVLAVRALETLESVEPPVMRRSLSRERGLGGGARGDDSLVALVRLLKAHL